MKFQDKEFILTDDFVMALEEFYQKKRYKIMLVVVDTCQAATLFEGVLK